MDIISNESVMTKRYGEFRGIPIGIKEFRMADKYINKYESKVFKRIKDDKKFYKDFTSFIINSKSVFELEHADKKFIMYYKPLLNKLQIDLKKFCSIKFKVKSSSREILIDINEACRLRLLGGRMGNREIEQLKILYNTKIKGILKIDFPK